MSTIRESTPEEREQVLAQLIEEFEEIQEEKNLAWAQYADIRAEKNRHQQGIIDLLQAQGRKSITQEGKKFQVKPAYLVTVTQNDMTAATGPLIGLRIPYTMLQKIQTAIADAVNAANSGEVPVKLEVKEMESDGN